MEAFSEAGLLPDPSSLFLIARAITAGRVAVSTPASSRLTRPLLPIVSRA
jgi:hypothetical protein